MINTIIVTAYLLGVIYFAFTEGKSDAFKISKNIPIDHVDAWIKRALTCLGMFGLAGVAIHPMTFRTFLLLPMAAFLFSEVFRSSLNDARGKVWFYMGAYIPMRRCEIQKNESLPAVFGANPIIPDLLPSVGKRSQRSVAKAAGISRHQLVAIEQASTNYTRITLFALAKEVGVDIKAIPK